MDPAKDPGATLRDFLFFRRGTGEEQAKFKESVSRKEEKDLAKDVGRSGYGRDDKQDDDDITPGFF